MNVRATWWLFGLVLLAGLPDREASADELCLFNPFITSIKTLEFGLINEKIVRFSMELELDHTILISLSNLVYDGQIRYLYLGGSRMRYKGKRTDSSIDYAQITNTKSSYSRNDYLKRLDKYWNKHSTKDGKLVSSALQIAEYCNDVRIYSAVARFSKRLDEKGSETLSFYGGNRRCHWRGQADMFDGFLSSPAYAIYRDINLGLDTKDIVSAAYIEPFLFEITADGLIHLKEMVFSNGQWIVLNILRGGSIQSDRCYLVNNAAYQSLDDDTRIDYTRGLPFRSVTKSTPDSFITIDSITYEPSVWNRSDPNQPFVENYIETASFFKFRRIEHGNFILEALSSLPDEKESHAHAIFSDRDNSKLVYYRDINIGNTNTPNSQVYTYKNVSAPDDITHWTTCKKIITVYGFAYTMHNYSDNILNDLSSWFRLERQWLDYRIEAMHAEGDEFWFFTKKTVVIQLKTEPNRCDMLRLSDKREIHFREAFGQKLRPGNYLEGRYYDGSQWVPPGLKVPRSPPDPPVSPDPPASTIPPISPVRPAANLIWLYVVVGVTGLILVIALAVLLRRYHKKPNVIYSKSQTSVVEAVGPSGKSPTIWKDPISQAESALPLFSEHESGLKKKTPPRRTRKSVSPRRSGKSVSPTRTLGVSRRSKI